jgi:RHS repeat-associated protein
VVERLSYDAWGKRRFPGGQDDPAGSISSQTTRGFTGQEELADVGLVHMNGRVYHPLLGRFGTPDPTTESPFSTQGWNRYSYVGNSPLNFTDPSGYCFAGCFWQAPFKALGALLRRIPIIGQILQIAAAVLICGTGDPLCAGVVSAITSAVTTGLASGKLGLALRAGFISAATAFAFYEVGQITGHIADFGTDEYFENVIGHAAVGCASTVASGGKCGPGALSAGVGAFAAPFMNGLAKEEALIAESTVGGLASVAGGGKFGNGAIIAAFGYLFNQAAGEEEENSRRGGGLFDPDPTAEVREDLYYAYRGELARVDPNNPLLGPSISTENWVPSWADVRDMQSAVNAIRGGVRSTSWVARSIPQLPEIGQDMRFWILRTGP